MKNVIVYRNPYETVKDLMFPIMLDSYPILLKLEISRQIVISVQGLIWHIDVPLMHSQCDLSVLLTAL